MLAAFVVAWSLLVFVFKADYRRLVFDAESGERSGSGSKDEVASERRLSEDELERRLLANPADREKHTVENRY
jgi:hypothetical protein